MNKDIQPIADSQAGIEAIPMLADVLCRGKMIVLIGFSVGEVVSFIDDKFPIEKIQSLITEGAIRFRVPSEIEKEYCFWFYNNIDKNEGAKLSGINDYIKHYK